MARMTDDQTRRAEQIVRRWLWAARLSVPADRTVEQAAVGELAVALLDQLLRDARRSGRLESLPRAA
jgi:hypothetical protein